MVPFVRGAVIGLIGSVAFAAGVATGVTSAAIAGLGWRDLAGIAAAVVGVVLLGYVFRMALRGRRRLALVPALLVALAFAQWVALPAVAAGLAAHAPREAVRRIAGVRDVTLASKDGTKLAAWYRPGRNGAGVVVLHGSHNDRSDTAAHVRLLARSGYAVLAFDARGHGESGGRANALGWSGVPDVAAAVAWLRARGVGRIGALGLSMGGEVALRAAAQHVPLDAVVADGAGASTLGDERLTMHGLTKPIAVSSAWLTMRAVELATGNDEPAPLERAVAAIHVPVLLIASNARGELDDDRAYARRLAAGDLWYVPDAGHTDALRVHPRAYERRVTEFLRDALRPE